ncbi:MAG TPA: protein-glutamate O-methyltransferase CheR [Usitatibacter sp.]|nr:protein-glutamate O-methyltransferase CheR [Usitatibacter sp.]
MSAITGGAWARFAERLGERLGLGFPPQRMGELRRTLARGAAALGFEDVDECASRLAVEPWDRARMDALASLFTVGETYFFRDPALFEALAGSVLPALVRGAARVGRPVRIWSAGCCTGEEAYSLAIVASQVLARFPGASVAIRATDVNARFLEGAAAASYGNWSFRGMSGDCLARHFVRLEDGRHAPRPEIRSLVQFAWDNLVEESNAASAAKLDLIVCRNVLMYFTPAQMRRTIRRLHEALAPGGWLVVSPSEAAAERFPGFAPVMRGGAFLYRKKDPAREPAAAPPIVPDEAALPPAAPLDVPPPIASYEVPSQAAAPPMQSLATRARACADRGALDEALGWCDRWLAAARLDPGAHYLRAMVLLERDERAAARAALTRALYLDPAHVMSHVACGHLARAEGSGDEARRHFHNALELLRRMPAEEPVADSDRMSAAALREALAALLEPAHPA